MPEKSKGEKLWVRVSKQELGFIEQETEDNNMTTSEYLRDMIRQKMQDKHVALAEEISEFKRLHQKNLKICMATYKIAEKLTENFDNLDKDELESIQIRCGKYAQDVLAGEM